MATLAFQSFWSQSWSAPLRSACRWLKRDPAPIVPPVPEALTPAGSGRSAFSAKSPVPFVIAWPGRMLIHTNRPCWTEEDWTPYRRGMLRTWGDEWLLEQVQTEVERLLRIVDTPPALLGEAVWAHAALGTCEHPAQLYRELRRRCGARAMRVALRRLLISYVSWVPEEEAGPPSTPETAFA